MGNQSARKAGGVGVKNQLEISPLAFIGALEQTVPFFAGEQGVCPPLAELAGEGEPAERRWSPLLESECRTGRELQRAWDVVQQEAH